MSSVSTRLKQLMQHPFADWGVTQIVHVNPVGSMNVSPVIRENFESHLGLLNFAA